MSSAGSAESCENPAEDSSLIPEDQNPPPEGVIDDPQDDGGPPERWVTVASFWEPMMAHIARLKLEAEQIPCCLEDENLVGTDWMWANALGGVKLQVPYSQAQRAAQILQQTAPTAGPDAEDLGADEGDELAGVDRSKPRACCSRCGSFDIRRTILLRDVAWVLLVGCLVQITVLILPVVAILILVYAFWGRTWTCNKCQHAWRGKPVTRRFEVLPPDKPA